MFSNGETSMTGLPHAEEIMTYMLIVSIQFQSVTDRQTEFLYQYHVSALQC